MAPGTYARIACWTSRTVFLAAVSRLTHASGWRSDRRRTFEAVMVALAEVADANGRDVQITARRLAAIVGCTMRTIRRHLAAARQVGLLVEVQTGRHTSPGERVEIYEKTDRIVWCIPSIRALTLPRERATTQQVNVRPPRSPLGSGERVQIVELTKPAARRNSCAKPARTPAPARPLAAQRAAAELVARWPWLTPGRQHIGAVADVLIRAGCAHWSGYAIATAVDRGAAARGWSSGNAPIRQPLAWLATVLARVMAANPEPPTTLRTLPERYGAHDRATEREQQTRSGRCALTVDEREVRTGQIKAVAQVAAKAFARSAPASGLDVLLARALAQRSRPNPAPSHPNEECERNHLTRCHILSGLVEGMTPMSVSQPQTIYAQVSDAYAKVRAAIGHGLEHDVYPKLS